ncbi:hypothetical protein FRC06_003831 [Ceratobasidium sp. 370]|nr:hypothetical protein FRC06_003831 [Ceratobasidium sp. 370]
MQGAPQPPLGHHAAVHNGHHPQYAPYPAQRTPTGQNGAAYTSQQSPHQTQQTMAPGQSAATSCAASTSGSNRPVQQSPRTAQAAPLSAANALGLQNGVNAGPVKSNQWNGQVDQNGAALGPDGRPHYANGAYGQRPRGAGVPSPQSPGRPMNGSASGPPTLSTYAPQRVIQLEPTAQDQQPDGRSPRPTLPPISYRSPQVQNGQHATGNMAQPGGGQLPQGKMPVSNTRRFYVSLCGFAALAAPIPVFPSSQPSKATQTPKATQILTAGLKEQKSPSRPGATRARPSVAALANSSRISSLVRPEGVGLSSRAEEWQWVELVRAGDVAGQVEHKSVDVYEDFYEYWDGKWKRKSDLGSTISSPFAHSHGTGVGLGLDTLFWPAFPVARAGSPFRPASLPKSAASGASGSYASSMHKNDEASETYRSGGSRSETARSETARSETYWPETNHSDTYRSETNWSDTNRSGTSDTYRTNGSDTYRTNGSDTYRTGTGASESVTVRSAGSVRSRSVASDTYRSGTGTYTGAGSETYRGGSGSETYRTGGSGSGRSRSVASGTYHSDTYMTGTGSDTCRAGGSDAGVSGFLSSMYPCGSDSGTRTVTGSRVASQGRSEGGFSQERSDSGFSWERTETVAQGRSESGFGQGSSTLRYLHKVRTRTRKVRAPSRLLPHLSCPSLLLLLERRACCAQRPLPCPQLQDAEPDHEDKFADWQERTPQADTPYSTNISLTPKTTGSMTPRTQAGAMTPRTPGGRFGKALSEASTAPTSAKGLMRQRMSREIVNGVPVPSESEATGLGHNGQDPVHISALWYLNVYAPPLFEWLRTQAVLYPNVLILTWIGPTGGRGVVALDLVNCIEVRSALSLSHPSARDDVGSVATRLQSLELAEALCPFQLLYADGVERLGTDTARERVRSVGAIWEALAAISCALTWAITERSVSPTMSLQHSSFVHPSSSECSASPTAHSPSAGTLSDLMPSPSLLERRSSSEQALTLIESSTEDSPTIYTLLERASSSRAPSERPPSTVPRFLAKKNLLWSHLV